MPSPARSPSSAAPRLFSIPAGVPFLPRLADALLSGELVDLGRDPVAALADTTIYLPTRRAGRALTALLADGGGARARLMPRIVPLGDADAVEPGLGEDGAGGLPPAIAPLERRLILTRLVQSWARQVDPGLAGLPPGTVFRIPGSPADAVELAGDLEALMDSLATEGVAWDGLADAVDTDYSQYFRLTLDFVRIAHAHWPAILAERGALDPAARRGAILDGEAARLAAAPPAGPVIAAGSTGSIPSTARLLAAIAHSPRGAVVLPGLDRDLDAEGWAAIAGDAAEGPVYGHPQFYLRRLVEHFCGADREAVRHLVGPHDPVPARRRLLSEAMRPAETTDSWAALPPAERGRLAGGASGIRLVEAADEREEALAIAIALRETLATPGRTAALVTPDRGLARRVAAEMRRWGVVIEDSAGLPLADSRPGRLARLAAEVAASDFAPARLLGLLAHPDVRLGRPRADVDRAAAALEIGVLRGPAPRPGLAGLGQALDLRRREAGRHDPAPRRRLSDEDWDLASWLLAELAEAFRGFSEPADGRKDTDLVALAAAHADVIGRLRALPGPHPEVPGGAGPRRTHDGDACFEAGLRPAPQHEEGRKFHSRPDTGDEIGEARLDALADTALADLFDDLAASDAAGLVGRLADYPAFFAALARGRLLPPDQPGAHRRVRILGLLEARLLHVDRVVLGGLDEGVWPPAARSDAFLNRPMRLKLDLTPPERRIGQTAHDFVQLLAMPDAVVTRAAKREGKPMIASRFLARLRALAGEEAWTGMAEAGQTFIRLGRALDRPGPVPPATRPAPEPGPDAFPRRLSVTEVETLVRDPYAIYARRILELDPLDALATAPGAADLGTLFHGVLAEFARHFPAELPAGAEADLIARGASAFAPYREAYPELVALWWPRFRRFVPEYLAWEGERRDGLASLHVEVTGALEWPLGDGAFTLTAQADRIELGRDGSATIVDYKTGTPPSNPAVAVGFSPQMTLEAAMLVEGAFRGLPAATVTPALSYVKIGARQPVEERPVKPPPKDARSLAAIIDAHLAGLRALVTRYGETGAPYLSRPYAQYARAYAPYDHLARVAEWSALNAEDE